VVRNPLSCTGHALLCKTGAVVLGLSVRDTQLGDAMRNLYRRDNVVLACGPQCPGGYLDLQRSEPEDEEYQHGFGVMGHRNALLLRDRGLGLAVTHGDFERGFARLLCPPFSRKRPLPKW